MSGIHAGIDKMDRHSGLFDLGLKSVLDRVSARELGKKRGVEY